MRLINCSAGEGLHLVVVVVVGGAVSISAILLKITQIVLALEQNRGRLIGSLRPS